VHVASLRSKLGLPGLIATVRGVGYQMVSQDSFMRLGAETVQRIREVVQDAGSRRIQEAALDAAGGMARQLRAAA
jgi:hypothetical protein